MLYDSEARYADLAQTLEHRIEIGPESHEELAALKFRLASVLHQHLSDTPRAIELYREVLMLMPEHEGALNALESLLGDAKLGGEAAAILVDVYEARGDFAQLTAALDVSVKFATDPAQRVGADRARGRGSARRAWVTQRARSRRTLARSKRRPKRLSWLLSLEALAAEHKRFPELLKLIETRAAKVSDPQLQRQLLIKAAQLYDSQVGDVDAAVKAYSKALSEDEGDEEILEALEALYRRTERWTDLLDVLRRRAAVSTDADFQEQSLAQIAFIHDEMLSDSESAIRVYAEILELNPQSRTALMALDSLYEREQKWSDLADNVRPAAVTGRRRAGTARADVALGPAARDAHECAGSGHRDLPRGVGARRQQRRCARGARTLLVHPEYQGQIAEIFEPLYREKAEYRETDRHSRHPGAQQRFGRPARRAVAPHGRAARASRSKIWRALSARSRARSRRIRPVRPHATSSIASPRGAGAGNRSPRFTRRKPKPPTLLRSGAAAHARGTDP